jgi:hypothetical protein
LRRPGLTFTKGLQMRTGARLVVLAALILSTCWSCGSDSSHYVGSTVPVKGKVTYKDKPLTQEEIVFEPDGSGREAHGNIQPDGTFELSTFAKGNGAVPGTHRVAVTSGRVGKEVVPVKYKNTSSSKTEVEVAEGKSEYFVDFK